MTDRITKEQRSTNMSKIRSSKTKPELKLKPLLKKLGFTFQPQGIFGKPDFANKKQKIAIFIDGCFWHGCRCKTRPKSNIVFWETKIKRNKHRDSLVNKTLKRQGWKVVRIWEHELAGVK